MPLHDWNEDRVMTNHAELLPRYQRLRAAGLAVNNTLVGRLKKDVIDEGARKLGLLQKGTLVFDSEAEMAVLMDYCLHDIRRQGHNTVQHYLAEAPFPAGSDATIYLQGLAKAYFSLFLVEAVEPGVGVEVRDLLRDQTLFLMDVGFGQSAQPGITLASRVMSVENFSMTTGAALPFGVLREQERAAFIKKMAGARDRTDYNHLSPEEASRITTDFIRASLRRGAASHVAYEDPIPGSSGSRLPASPGGTGRVGRNDPCPCGSGKKFKKCCGAAR
jgi:hypothetical protein